MPNSSLWFRWLAIMTCAATYGLIIVGAVVRVTGSGDACPDWPTCHGQLIPPADTNVLIEFSHRLLASAVSFLVLGLAIGAWRTRQNAVVRWGSLAAIGLIVVQIVLGGLTVLSDLSANMVMAHLATGAMFFASLLIVTIFSLPIEPAALPEQRAAALSFRTLAAAGAIATLLLMLTGSYVSGSGAGLAFRDWPLFDGGLLPDGARLAIIHFTHRVAALLIGFVVAGVAVSAWRTQRWNALVIGSAVLACAVYVAQVIVGAANIWTLLQPAAVGAHVALAVALWGTMVAMAAFAQRAAAPVAELTHMVQTERPSVTTAPLPDVAQAQGQ